ncbi:MAG: Holliday junction branch migration protein RuvA [Nitrospira sp.]|nr:Holliday junction branch migration protein RuvA [Candidatus Manganitrophaceae bacterium]HIL35465.1 Holliday junction branch migration protein RuvA [Candidatus Manganitrophaceae bacterium]
MIASINGHITQKTPTALIIEVQGLGYQVHVPLTTYYRLPEVKEVVALQIYTYVREDVLQLYGFLSLLEKEFFLLLISVSGIGPKLGLNILSGMETGELIDAIRNGNVQRLRAIPGVGPKMAGRLALELKEKVSSLYSDHSGIVLETTTPGNKVSEDALSALMNLGYHRTEARRVIENIVQREEAQNNGDIDSVEGLIKLALKGLAKIK